MPGQLRKTSRCPICHSDIVASFRTSRLTKKGPITEYEYYHRNKRKKSCKEEVKGYLAVNHYEEFVYKRLHVPNL